MKKIYLVVNSVSYRYVTKFTDDLSNIFKERFGEDFSLCIIDEVNCVKFEPRSLVFIVGEIFNPFERVNGCYYVYLNFSVVFNLGGILHASFSALKMQKVKREKIKAKLPSIDLILDYYPQQVDRLSKLVTCPVRSFPVGIAPLDTIIPLDEREFDVGFVGGASSRRHLISQGLQDVGLSLSPQTDVKLEDLLQQSRICLNVHVHRSLHIEYPRILGAFATGAALVTEKSYGLSDAFPDNTYVAVKYGDVVKATVLLLRDRDKMRGMTESARNFLTEQYLPKYYLAWNSIIDEVIERSSR